MARKPVGFLQSQWHKIYWVGIPLLTAAIATLTSEFAVDHIKLVSAYEADRMVQLKQTHPPDPNSAISLITFDEKTKLRFPDEFVSPRSIFARLIRKLRQSGTKVLLVDLVFANPRKGQDKDLNKAIHEPGQMAITLSSTIGELADDPDEVDGKKWEYADLSYLGVDPGNDQIRPATNSVFTVSSFDIGAVMYRFDKDMRRWLLHTSLSAVLQYRDISESDIRFDPKLHEIRAGGMEWTLQGNDALLVQWTSDPTPFPRHDLYDVLYNYSAEKLRKEFQGKLVILGTTEKTIDPIQTDRGDLHGVDFMAQLANMLLLSPGDRLQAAGSQWQYTWFLTIAGLACLSAMSARFVWMTLGSIVYAFLAFIIPEVVARSSPYLVETAAPVLGVFTAFLIGIVARVWIPKPGRLAGAEFDATAMFVDLKASTNHLRTMGPQSYRLIYSQISNQIATVAFKFGGEVERTTGDGAFILFPSGRAAHHALSAIRAIKPIRDAIDALGHSESVDLGVTFGLESGLLTGGYVVEGGRKTWSSSGSAVNMAHRLQEALDLLRIDIAIGPVAARLVEGHIRLTQVGEIDAQGFEGKVPVWTLPLEEE